MSSLESHATATAAASEPKWPDGACNGCGTIPKYYVDRELAKDEEYYVKHCLNPKDGVCTELGIPTNTEGG